MAKSKIPSKNPIIQSLIVLNNRIDPIKDFEVQDFARKYKSYADMYADNLILGKSEDTLKMVYEVLDTFAKGKRFSNLIKTGLMEVLEAHFTKMGPSDGAPEQLISELKAKATHLLSFEPDWEKQNLSKDYDSWSGLLRNVCEKYSGTQIQQAVTMLVTNSSKYHDVLAPFAYCGRILPGDLSAIASGQLRLAINLDCKISELDEVMESLSKDIDELNHGGVENFDGFHHCHSAEYRVY